MDDPLTLADLTGFFCSNDREERDPLNESEAFLLEIAS